MIVIGIILILLGLVVGSFVVAGSLPADTGTDVSFSLFGLTVETSVVVVFALGAITLLLLELGVLALRSGAKKSSRRRAELQRLRRVEAEVQSRQASDSQRNATTASSTAPAAPAPFARREPDPSTRPTPATTGSPSSSSPSTSGTGSSGTGSSATGSSATGSSATGSSATLDPHGPGQTGDHVSDRSSDTGSTAAPASTRPPTDGQTTTGDTRP